MGSRRCRRAGLGRVGGGRAGPGVAGATTSDGRSSGTAGPSGAVAGWPGAAAGGPPALPTVTLPAGGGAIRGIEEKFTVDLATGTASLTIPISTSPGRGGFGPSLTLAYDSGAGNGPFGLGWTVPLPAITRKTSKGLPTYADDPDADTFLLTGSDDLVPVREERDGRWQQVVRRRWTGGRSYEVRRYRPRIEATFARAERWRDLGSGETHWRTISPGNVTAIYGASSNSRIYHPADPARVFSWLICESHDGTGNAIVYEYLAEDSTGVDTGPASERHRTHRSRSANRYLKRIRYGNRVPWPAVNHGDGGGRAAEHDERPGAAAERHRDAALRDLNDQQRQIEHTAEVQDFLRDKFTSSELYLYLQRETAALYRQMYDLALHTARRAQRAFNRERGHTARRFLPNAG